MDLLSQTIIQVNDRCMICFTLCIVYYILHIIYNTRDIYIYILCITKGFMVHVPYWDYGRIMACDTNFVVQLVLKASREQVKPNSQLPNGSFKNQGRSSESL